MHSKIEIIIPPTDDVEASVKQVMQQFDENGTDEDGICNSHAFWDFYVIGGRWAGDKELSKLDQDKLASFYKALEEKNVTVSGFQAGKQTLSPESQIPMVDSLWKDYFPDCKSEGCPLFSHSNDQYSEALQGDICKVSEVTDSMTCEKLLIAGQGYMGNGEIECKHLLQRSVWNGVNHEDTNFSGKILDGVSMYMEKIDGYTEDFKQKNTPNDDWLVVTVDIHS